MQLLWWPELWESILGGSITWIASEDQSLRQSMTNGIGANKITCSLMLSIVIIIAPKHGNSGRRDYETVRIPPLMSRRWKGRGRWKLLTMWLRNVLTIRESLVWDRRFGWFLLVVDSVSLRESTCNIAVCIATSSPSSPGYYAPPLSTPLTPTPPRAIDAPAPSTVQYA